MLFRANHVLAALVDSVVDIDRQIFVHTERDAHEIVDPVLDLESSYNIVTLHPRSYSDARQMAEHYREGNPVIINLDDMDDSERKRLVDFASGLAFGLRGRIEKITSVVFLLSPANVTVRTEDKAAYAQASFYNQS